MLSQLPLPLLPQKGHDSRGNGLGGVIRGDGDFNGLELVAEPGALALGQLAGARGYALDGLLKRQLATRKGQRLGVADGSCGGFGGRSFAEDAHCLLDDAFIEHLAGTQLNASRKGVPFHGEEECGRIGKGRKAARTNGCWRKRRRA